MLQAPEMLFGKASALGFQCVTTSSEHSILPSDTHANWALIYRSGHWVLSVNGIPQMHLRYAEVIDFLERRSQATSSSPLAGDLQTA